MSEPLDPNPVPHAAPPHDPAPPQKPRNSRRRTTFEDVVLVLAIVAGTGLFAVVLAVGLLYVLCLSVSWTR